MKKSSERGGKKTHDKLRLSLGGGGKGFDLTYLIKNLGRRSRGKKGYRKRKKTALFSEEKRSEEEKKRR